ncbi:MAG: CYTH domain-containing protein, partial [Allobaculum sp.]|nr:CYTH domain-containing protein [Allobaculum sp.]
MSDQEQELKLLIQKDQAQALLKNLPIQETRHQVNTYYDTPDKALR